MELFVQSLSPEGINLSNGFALEADYRDVVEVERISEVDGVIDHNKVLSLSDMCITQVSIDAQRDIDFYMAADKPMIEINFSISSDTVFEIEGFKKPLDLGPNQHNIIYHPNGAYKSKNRAGISQELISIMVSPSFVEKYIPRQREFTSLLDSLQNEKTGLLSEYNLPITTDMRILLNELQENKITSQFRRMFIETKVTELLMLQMEQFYSFSTDQPRYYGVNRQDYERMLHAKEIIESNLSNPCSLIDLAHQIGTNEFTLKKAFKQIFGTTVYGHLNKIRMREAKKQLLSGELNVNEVAMKMGYNDATNFIAAFRKYFGFTPGKMIKSR